MNSSDNNYSIFNPLFYLSGDLYGFGESEKVLQDSQSSNDQGSINIVSSHNNGVPGRMNDLPPELLAKIFSGLDLADFRKGSQVCHTLNKQLTNYPGLGKRIVYHDKCAMSPEKYEEHFGNDVIPFEKFKKQAEESMPMDIVKTLNKLAFVSKSPKCSLSTTEETPARKIGDTHVLFYVDESFTINQLGKLFKQCLGNANGYEYINPRVVNQYGDQSIGQSGWWLLTKEILPGSRNKSPQAHKVMIVDLAEKTGLPYEQPDLVRVLAGMIARYVSTGERIFSDEPWTYTSVVEEVNGRPCYVGGFDSSGPNVDSNDLIRDSYGAAAALRCGSAEVF